MTYAILGAGRSGLSAQRLLLRRGVSPDEIVFFDEKPKDGVYSDPERLLSERKPDVYVVSPGFPLSRRWLRDAIQAGAALTSEISLAVDSLADEKIVAITGSVGKSTTAALIAEAARTADPHCFLGGNFGIPLAAYAADVLEGKRPRARWIVLELSSFQLENCEGLRPDIGVITSFVANHLERYPDLDSYYATKWSLISRCRRVTLINANGGDVLAYARKHPGEWIAVDRRDRVLAPLRLTEARLIGEHNQDNLAMAATVAGAAGWGEAAIGALKSFAGLSHRLEFVAEVDGVRFINDSKATAIDSVNTAIDAVRGSSAGRIFLLVGGRDKNLPWQELATGRRESRIVPLWFGECGAMAREKSGWNGDLHPRLADAFRSAKKQASRGDVVLLSPGGSSLDEFKNFEERGDAFIALTKNPQSAR